VRKKSKKKKQQQMATGKIPQYAIYHKFVIYCQIIFISHLHLYGPPTWGRAYVVKVSNRKAPFLPPQQLKHLAQLSFSQQFPLASLPSFVFLCVKM